jgi:hypothetical protein
MNDAVTTNRAAALRHALALEYLTIGWNVVEGLVAVTAGSATLGGTAAERMFRPRQSS